MSQQAGKTMQEWLRERFGEDILIEPSRPGHAAPAGLAALRSTGRKVRARVARRPPRGGDGFRIA